jgi:ABC-2 type transport system permease protein
VRSANICKRDNNPLYIYTHWFRDLLTVVVPARLRLVAAGLGHANRTGAPDWLLPLTPVVGFVFFGVSLWVWGFGVRRYTSTGT